MALASAVESAIAQHFAGKGATAARDALDHANLPLVDNSDLGPGRARIHLAILLLAQGNAAKVQFWANEAEKDWRDVLVAAGLENADWPEVLRAKGMPIPT